MEIQVIVGTVVTRSPNSNIASIAMRDFNLALTLFEQTAAQSQRAKVALVSLNRSIETTVFILSTGYPPEAQRKSEPGVRGTLTRYRQPYAFHRFGR